MPSGFRAVAEPPSAEQLDPFHSASEDLVNKVLLVRIEGYGWCRGVILEQVPNRTRKVGGVQVNFIAKFDIDEFSTDLALEAKDYDTSYSAGVRVVDAARRAADRDGRWAHVRSRL